MNTPAAQTNSLASNHRLEFAVLILALVLRLALVLFTAATTSVTPDGITSRAINGDATHYLLTAENMVDHGVFSLSTTAPYEPDILRTPGYPVVLAALYWLGGGQHNIPLIVAINAALGVLSTWLVMWLGRVLFTRPVALVAGVLFAISPAALIQTGIAITETLYGTLLLGGLALALLAARPARHGWLMAVLAGLVFAWATYTRPIGLYFVALPALCAVVFAPQKRTGVGRATVIVIVYVLALLPWFARSARLFGDPVFSSLANQNLLMYNVSSVEAQRQGISWTDAKTQLWEEYGARLDTLGIQNPNQAETSRVMGELAREHILAHPIPAALGQTRDMLNVLRPGYSMAILLLRGENAEDFGVAVQEGNLSVFSQSNIVELLVFGLMTAYYGVLYLGIAGGGVLLLARREWAALLLLGGTAFYHLYLPGSAGNSRFRTPVESLLALIAALALVWLWQRIQPRLPAARR